MQLLFFFYTIFAVIVVLYRMHASHLSLTDSPTTLDEQVERVQGSRPHQPQNVAQAEAEKFQISLALSLNRMNAVSTSLH